MAFGLKAGMIGRMSEEPYDHQNSDTEENQEKKPSIVGSILMALCGLASVAYLLNPGAGFIELIPDNVPFLGNLDEAAATGLLIAALSYFGLDLKRIVRGGASKEEEAAGEKSVSGKVVEN